MYAPTARAARPAIQRSNTWDDLAGLKARLSRPGTPLTPPLPQITDPRASHSRSKAHSVEYVSSLAWKTEPPTHYSTTSPIITVSVGQPVTEFHIHRSALTRSSTFLQMKCKPEWLKGEAIVELSDYSPEAFAIYSDWLYTTTINSTPSTTGMTEVAQNRAEWLDLACSYVLGEALIDTCFNDTIMDAIRAKVLGEAGDTIWETAVEMIQIVYDGTSESSCARHFLVDLYHYHAHPRHLQAGKDGMPRDFLFELALAHSADTYKPPVYGFSGVRSGQCSYHFHGSVACYLDGGH